MNIIKQRLSAYRKTLSMLGIERELGLPPRTIKMWLHQNTEPSQENQLKIAQHLKSLGKGL